MTEHWLDRVARGIALPAASRRGVIRLSVGGVLVALGLRPDDAAAACLAPTRRCKTGRQCCTKRCTRGRCIRCPNGARFLPAPNLLCWLAWGADGTGNGQFRFPRGVAARGTGPVYVADTSSSRIQQFDASGRFVRKWGGSGSGNGKFSSPFGVAVGGTGQVYVADTNNDRVVRVRPL